MYGHKTYTDSDTIMSIESTRHGIIERGHVCDDGLLIRVRHVNIWKNISQIKVKGFSK